MPKITLIEFNGQEHIIEAEAGSSLMQSAINNGVPGIDGDCGGASACGTCHCFVEDKWINSTGDIENIEEDMLIMRPDRTENSRLSCQIQVSDTLDGLVIHLPEYQM